MKTYCVSYDLVSDDRNVKSLEDVLTKLNGVKIQESTWILKSDDKIDYYSLKNSIESILKEKDRLFIAKIDPNYISINSY